MIGIINLGFSNKTSICNTMLNLDLEFEVFDDASKCSNYKGIILPGVGNFKKASEELDDTNFRQEIKKFVKNNGFFLGICLGMQLLFTSSEEGNPSEGLNIINGDVISLNLETHKTSMHVGWNEAFEDSHNSIDIFNNITNEENFYFVHGYHAIVKENVKSSYTSLGSDKILSAVNKDNTYGVQFHPEKSHKPGQKLLINFYKKALGL